MCAGTTRGTSASFGSKIQIIRSCPRAWSLIPPRQRGAYRERFSRLESAIGRGSTRPCRHLPAPWRRRQTASHHRERELQQRRPPSRHPRPCLPNHPRQQPCLPSRPRQPCLPGHLLPPLLGKCQVHLPRPPQLLLELRRLRLAERLEPARSRPPSAPVLRPRPLLPPGQPRQARPLLPPGQPRQARPLLLPGQSPAKQRLHLHLHLHLLRDPSWLQRLPSP
jgi:hypothetical protein